MKTSVNLKFLAVIVLLLAVMSSCLKKDDSLSIYVQYPYILQNSNGTFSPQIRLLGNDLQSASINVAGRNFTFKHINGVVWELTDSYYAPLGELDSIPAGYYALTATALNGKTASVTVGLSEAKKKIGDVKLAKLEYAADEKVIHVELTDSVQNANAYYLMIKLPSGSATTNTFAMWTPYSSLSLTGDRKLSASVPVPDLENGKYRFAVGAGYGSVCRISEQDIIIGEGTSTSE